MKRKVLVVIVLAAMAAGGCLYWWFGRTSAVAAAPISTAAIERGPIRMTVEATGRVIANLDVDIKCKASGEIKALPFDVSDAVKQGDLLVELDPVDEQRVVHQSEVMLSASQAKLETARQNLAIAELTLRTDRRKAQAALKSAQASAADARSKADRVKLLLDKKLSSQEEYDTAETLAAQVVADLETASTRLEELKTQETALEVQRQNVRLAEATVESDTISLSISQDRLKDTKVVAPMDGVVSARNVQIGQIIASGVSNVGGGTTVLTLSDLSHIYVVASVDESLIGKVEVGLPVRITADAFPDRSFGGKVVRIATRGVNLSNVVTFEVKIEVTGEDKSLLKPEMTTNVKIIAAEKEDALTVPAEAIVRRQGKTMVTVVQPGGGSEDRVVEAGISDGIKTEILRGLTDGDRVLLRKGGAEGRWNAQGGPRRPQPLTMPPPARGRGL